MSDVWSQHIVVYTLSLGSVSMATTPAEPHLQGAGAPGSEYVSTFLYNLITGKNYFKILQDNFGEDLAEELRKTNRFVPDKEFSGTDRSAAAARSGIVFTVVENFILMRNGVFVEYRARFSAENKDQKLVAHLTRNVAADKMHQLICLPLNLKALLKNTKLHMVSNINIFHFTALDDFYKVRFVKNSICSQI